MPGFCRPSHNCNYYAIGFWKTDQIVTLGIFHVIDPTNSYTSILHIHSAINNTWLTGLLSWSKFCRPCKFMTETMAPILRVLHGKHICESGIHPSDSEMSLRPSKHVLGQWLALLRFMVSPNNPDVSCMLA